MVLVAPSNSDSKHIARNYEFAVKFYLDLSIEDKKAITALALTSFGPQLNNDIDSDYFEDTLFGTLSILLYFKDEIIGYCSLAPYLDKEFSNIFNKKYTTFGIHWLCVDENYRGMLLGTEILAHVYNIVQNIANTKPNPVLLFGEFTDHSLHLSRKLWLYDPNLILGYGKQTKLGTELAKNYASFWSECKETFCTTDQYGLLSTGRSIVALKF
jgi:GNAT superfamily N-acetyltransferase